MWLPAYQIWFSVAIYNSRILPRSSANEVAINYLRARQLRVADPRHVVAAKLLRTGKQTCGMKTAQIVCGGEFRLSFVRISNARLVVDRFHLAQKLSLALSQARRAIQEVAPPDVKAALKGAFWLLVKNRENRTTWLERAQASDLQAWRTFV